MGNSFVFNALHVAAFSPNRGTGHALFSDAAGRALAALEDEMNENSGSEARRNFLKDLAGTAAAAAATAFLVPKRFGESTVADASTKLGTAPPGTDEVLRMTADLTRALEKDPKDRCWAMVIDTRRCIGCSACTAACIAENNLTPGVTYRTVPEAEEGEYPNVHRIFMPTNCAQCEKPPCVPAANKVIPGAMKKRPDGIIEVDYQKAKGKKVFEAAKKACPYSALYLDPGKPYTAGTPALQPYENRSVLEYGKSWSRKETANAVRKCHFCAQRLDVGILPACVTTCTGIAMHFGDISDPKSLVAELMASGRARRLEASKGTGPRIHYLDDFPEAGADVPAIKTRSVVDCTTCHDFESKKWSGGER